MTDEKDKCPHCGREATFLNGKCDSDDCPSNENDKEKKKESIRDWVAREFAGIPQEWIKVISERLDDFAAPLPMWGTMWIVDSFIGEKLMKKSRRMCGDAEELRDNLDAIEDNDEREKVKSALDELAAEKISWGETALLDDYIDEEMAGARNITGTAAYIYEIDGRYVIGVNGAGWDFYDGVWNNLYDLCGMEWHKGPSEYERGYTAGRLDYEDKV